MSAKFRQIPLALTAEVVDQTLLAADHVTLTESRLWKLLEHARCGTSPSESELSALCPPESQLSLSLSHSLSIRGIEVVRRDLLRVRCSEVGFDSPVITVEFDSATSLCSLEVSWDGKLQHLSRREVDARWAEVSDLIDRLSETRAADTRWMQSASDRHCFTSALNVVIRTHNRDFEREDLDSDLKLSLRPDLVDLCAEIQLIDEDGNQRTVASRASELRDRLASLLTREFQSIDEYGQPLSYTIDELRGYGDKKLAIGLSIPFLIAQVGERLLVVGPSTTGHTALAELEALRTWEGSYKRRHPADPEALIETIEVIAENSVPGVELLRWVGVDRAEQLNASIEMFLCSTTATDFPALASRIVGIASNQPVECVLSEYFVIYNGNAGVESVWEDKLFEEHEPDGEEAQFDTGCRYIPDDDDPLPGTQEPATNESSVQPVVLIRRCASVQACSELPRRHGASIQFDLDTAAEESVGSSGLKLATPRTRITIAHLGGEETNGESGPFPRTVAESALQCLGIPNGLHACSEVRLLPLTPARLAQLTPEVSAIFS